MLPKLMVALAIGWAVFGATLGAAANITATVPNLGASDPAVTACDTDGLSVSWGPVEYDPSISAYKITTVTVSGIASACRVAPSAQLRLQLTTTGGAPLGDEKVISNIDGASGFSFDFEDEDIAAAAVEDIHIALVGP